MYREIAKTKKYALIECPGPGLFRIENRNGLYSKEVPHIEIPKNLAEIYEDILSEYVHYPKGEKKEAKISGQVIFDEMNDRDFENEHSELYPEQYL